MLKHCAETRGSLMYRPGYNLQVKFIITWHEISSGLRVPKVITISSFLTYSTNKKVKLFGPHCISVGSIHSSCYPFYWVTLPDNGLVAHHSKTHTIHNSTESSSSDVATNAFFTGCLRESTCLVHCIVWKFTSCKTSSQKRLPL